MGSRRKIDIVEVERKLEMLEKEGLSNEDSDRFEKETMAWLKKRRG